MGRWILQPETIQALREALARIDANIETLAKAADEFQQAKFQADAAIRKIGQDSLKLLAGKAAILKDIGEADG
jgi:hypothetical protein